MRAAFGFSGSEIEVTTTRKMHKLSAMADLSIQAGDVREAMGCVPLGGIGALRKINSLPRASGGTEDGEFQIAAHTKHRSIVDYEQIFSFSIAWAARRRPSRAKLAVRSSPSLRRLRE